MAWTKGGEGALNSVVEACECVMVLHKHQGLCVCFSLSWRNAWKRAWCRAPPCFSLSPPRRYLLLSWGNWLNIHECASNGSAGLAFLSQGRKWKQIHAWGSLQVGIQGQLNGWFKGYKICMMSLFSSMLACPWRWPEREVALEMWNITKIERRLLLFDFAPN